MGNTTKYLKEVINAAGTEFNKVAKKNFGKKVEW
jgi:hypothetical protein